jgi:hypothetical protein
MPPELTAAVLRSWEERFGAVPVQLDPSTVVLHADAPPTSVRQVRALAAEMAAITENVEDLRDAEQLLLTPPPLPRWAWPHLSTTLWRIAFVQQFPDVLRGLVDH